MGENFFTEYQNSYAKAQDTRLRREQAQREAEQHEANMRYSGLQSDALAQKIQQLEESFEMQMIDDVRNKMIDAVSAFARNDKGPMAMLYQNKTFMKYAAPMLGNSTGLADMSQLNPDFVKDMEELGASNNPYFKPLWLQTPKGPALYDVNMFIPFLSGAENNPNIQKMMRTLYKAPDSKAKEPTATSSITGGSPLETHIAEQIQQYKANKDKMSAEAKEAFFDQVLSQFAGTYLNAKGAEDAKHNTVNSLREGSESDALRWELINKKYQGQDISGKGGLGGLGGAGSGKDTLTEMDVKLSQASAADDVYTRSLHLNGGDTKRAIADTSNAAYNALLQVSKDPYTLAKDKPGEAVRVLDADPLLKVAVDHVGAQLSNTTNEMGLQVQATAVNMMETASDTLLGLQPNDIGAIDYTWKSVASWLSDGLGVPWNDDEAIKMLGLTKQAVDRLQGTRGNSKLSEETKKLLNEREGFMELTAGLITAYKKAYNTSYTIGSRGGLAGILSRAPQLKKFQDTIDALSAIRAIYDKNRDRMEELQGMQRAQNNGRIIYTLVPKDKTVENAKTNAEYNFVLNDEGELISLKDLEAVLMQNGRWDVPSAPEQTKSELDKNMELFKNKQEKEEQQLVDYHSNGGAATWK